MATAEVQVAARGKASHRVDLSTPGVVTWELSAGDYDIGVEVTWLADGAPDSERFFVMPSLRIAKDKASFIATSKGALEFNFDNSYSMMRSKVVAMKFSKRPLDEKAKAAARLQAFDVEKHSVLFNRVAGKGVGMFFTNRFDESEEFFAYERLRVPVYALSWATLACTRALLTMEPSFLDEARQRVTFLQALCEHYLPKDSSLLASIKGSLSSGGGAAEDVPTSGGKLDTSVIAAAVAAKEKEDVKVAAAAAAEKQSFTPMQLEAQLIYAEGTLLSSFLFLFEESVVSLLKCGMSIRSGWKLYQQVDKAMGCPVSSMEAGEPLSRDTQIAAPETDIPSLAAIDSGTLGSAHRALCTDALSFGVGIFSTLASILPAAVLKVLSALGLPTERETGLAQLRHSLSCGGVRSPLAALGILAMRILLPSFHTGDVGVHGEEADACVELMLKQYPKGALWTWMGGRLARMRGDSARATALFGSCAAAAGKELLQLDHLVCYEQAWVHAFRGEWSKVLPLHARLAAENAWSKAYYSYVQGIASLQLGALAEARAHFRATLRYGAGARRLGGRVIPAEQYGVRRAAEFIAFTRIMGESADMEEEERALYTVAGVEGPATAIVRVLLPPTVPAGSAAHAAALSYPCPLPGLESVYLFNGFPSMSPSALHGSIVQVDAILAAIKQGSAFDLAGRARVEAQAGEGRGDASGWAQAEESPILTAEALTSLLDSAAGVPLVGITQPKEGREDASKGAGTPATPGSPAPKGGLGGMLGGLGGKVGGLVSSVSSKVATVAAGATQVASLAAGAAGSALAKAGVQVPTTSYSPYAVATPLAPVHAVAVAAMMRGAACASLGRVEEAAAAFAWVQGAGAAGRLKRDMHLPAYAWYETGLLYLDAARLLKQGASPTSTRAGSSREAAMRQGLLTSSWAKAQGLNYALAKAQCVKCMKAARAFPEDFNWKVRLGIRVHLAYDELGAGEAGGSSTAVQSGGATPSKGAGAATPAAEDADTDEFAEAAAEESLE